MLDHNTNSTYQMYNNNLAIQCSTASGVARILWTLEVYENYRRHMYARAGFIVYARAVHLVGYVPNKHSTGVEHETMLFFAAM